MTDAWNRIVQKLWSFCQVLRDQPHVIASEVADDRT